MLVSHAATIIALVRNLLDGRNLPLRVGCCSLMEFVGKEGGKLEGGRWMGSEEVGGRGTPSGWCLKGVGIRGC